MSKAKKPKTTKAIIYARFSPRRNADECESIETQEHYCRHYCEKHGYEVVAVFADPDVSGSDEDRQQLWDAIDALKRGYVLVTYKADRLARGVYLDEAIRRAVTKAGAVVEVVEGSPNGDEPQDVLIRQVLAAFAEYERKVIAARTRAAMRRPSGHARAHPSKSSIAAGRQSFVAPWNRTRPSRRFSASFCRCIKWAKATGESPGLWARRATHHVVQNGTTI